MCEWKAPLLLGLLLTATPAAAAAEPAFVLLDLPFKVAHMRGPRSEVAVSVATSGLLATAGRKSSVPNPADGDEESAPIVVVWGEGGGAALALVDGAIRTTLIGAEAIEGLSASETPRGALPGSRRALAGPLSAYLTGATRAAGGLPGAAGLTIRERRPMAVSTDPKPVPISTITVPAGAEAVFASFRPRALRLSGRPVFAAATLNGAAASGFVLVGRQGEGPEAGWSVVARTPPQEGTPARIAGIADFTGAGAPQVALVKGAAGAGTLQLWSLGTGSPTLSGEAAGYLGGPGDADLAATVEPERGGLPDLALPSADGQALAVVAMKGGLHDRLRVPLPAPAATGVASLGAGGGARVLVGLADGRVAVVSLDGAKP
ncbi:hypothetical protein [Methylobacterium trifolii]|uniref:WD40 repeat domain-containing protein n=1 Tax=Methylobacterium trifolii TaxID=1003092 RepID=A0ABQ4TZD4_9HYPH|nr:hypothetical protein [Methylobacterium trifolii]GJE60571.1 hypothetical protein MPOCJGCO_2684 [Methylobacterium trifolii]